MSLGLVDFQADEQNDLQLLVQEDGLLDFALCDGRVQVAQDLHTRFGTWAGEWFLDTRAGVRYREDVLVKAPNLAIVEAMFRKLIVSTPGVLRIDTFSLDYSRAKRSVTLAFVAVTPWGNLPAQGEAIGAGMLVLLFPALGSIVP